MKLQDPLPEAAAAPVLSEARKRASTTVLRQRYLAHQQATSLTPAQEFQQMQAAQGAK